MRVMGSSLAVLAALLAQPSLAQSSNDVCQVTTPATPQVDWHGTAAYGAKAVVKDGRVVQVEIRALNGGVERRAQRSMVMAIQQALRDAKCQPGDHEFEQTFRFDIPPPAKTTG